MATYFAFFNQNSPLLLPKKRLYLTHLLKFESRFIIERRLKTM